MKNTTSPLRTLAIALVTLAILVLHATATESLIQRGTGTRTKPILGALYQLTLSVPETLATADAKTLITADQPMEFALELQSRLITRTRFVDTTTEGFQLAAKSGYPTEQAPAFLAQFSKTEFQKGDHVLMRYAAGTLTTIYRTSAGAETTLGAITDLTLKQALFAIWLGETPAQDSLKKSLLATP